MKTLIVYSSKYGTTKKCAELLAKNLEADLLDCDQELEAPTNYEQVILGSSVYMGQIRKSMKKYINRYIKIIKTKKIALFMCSGNVEDFSLFPYNLNQNPHVHLGYAYPLSEMKFMDKLIVKKIAGVTSDTDAINYQAIETFKSHL